MGVANESTGHDPPRTTIDAAGLKAWRTRHGYSQTQLATELDVNHDTLARWERGDLTIRHARILFLALLALELRHKATATTHERSA